MSVVVIIPYAPLCEARTRAMKWNVARWRDLLPRAQILVATDGHDGDRGPGAFNKPRAVNEGMRIADDSTDVFVVADCDTTTDDSIHERIGAAMDGVWSVPAVYRRLTEPQTEGLLLHGTPRFAILPESSDQEYTRASWSGVVVLPREAIEAIGGRFDERFDGWSADDIALAMALETLWAPVERMGTVWHLDHPRPLEDTYGRAGYDESRDLTDRYQAAYGKPNQMRRVISGA